MALQYILATDLKAGDGVTVAGINYELESDPVINGQDEVVVHLLINRATSAWVELVMLKHVVLEVFRTSF